MDAIKIAESTQEQGIAAWIDSLNQLRLNELLAKLSAQDLNLERALAELQKMKVNIAALIGNNRGGTKGAHGFIAEAAEVGIENARNLIKGLSANCEWLNDNGPADILRGGVEIQQKFVQAGGHLGLEAIKAHLEKYPNFIQNGGKYQIPKDFYDDLQRVLALSQEEAAKEPTSTYQLWKWVHTFFDENKITPNDIEPAAVGYQGVQSGKIGDTIQKEEGGIKAEDRRRRDEAYEASKPTLREGVKAAGISAAMEGGMAFCLGIRKKHKQGKRLSEFTAKDWKDVGIDTTRGTTQGAIRGGAVYAMTNFTATPAAVANAFVTAAFGVTGQGIKFHRGEISTEEFVENSEILCLEVSISAVSAMLGQAAIPIPILGAMIGNMAGMFMYQIAKDNLGEKEQRAIRAYQKSFSALDQALDERYHALLAVLKKELEKFSSILEFAFDPDVNIAFAGSIALADYVGVDPKKVLRNKRDIDQYFLN